jgi:hypothetical protein
MSAADRAYRPAGRRSDARWRDEDATLAALGLAREALPSASGSSVHDSALTSISHGEAPQRAIALALAMNVS